MNISYSTIRRVRITAPVTEREKVFAWVCKNGYQTKTSGPVRRGAFGADITRIRVVAEKKIVIST